MIELKMTEEQPVTKMLKSWSEFVRQETERKSELNLPKPVTDSGEILLVPEGLSVDETALWIRQQLIARNADPDSAYLVAVDYENAQQPLEPTFTISFDYGGFNK